MDTTKWKSVAIRTDIVKMADKIAKKTERPKRRSESRDSFFFSVRIQRTF